MWTFQYTRKHATSKYTENIEHTHKSKKMNKLFTLPSTPSYCFDETLLIKELINHTMKALNQVANYTIWQYQHIVLGLIKKYHMHYNE